MSDKRIFIKIAKVEGEKAEITDRIVDKVANEIGLDFGKIDRNEFAMGMNVELEHNRDTNGFPRTNICKDDMTMVARIAVAHLAELPDYYTRLAKMEEEGKRELGETGEDEE